MTNGSNAWAEGWERRIRDRVRALGQPSLAAFFEAYPLASYNELAQMLGSELDVAPVQMERLHFQGFAERPDMLPQGVKDSLARHLLYALPRGWGEGRYWESRVLGELSGWSVQWGDLPWMDRIFQELCKAAPKGWRPTGSQDPIIEQAVANAEAT